MDVNESFAAFHDGKTIPHSPCLAYRTPNHQAVIVGYGNFKKTPVWVVRNSFGPSWGADGYFYLEIGKNSFCAEYSAFTLVPKNFTPGQVPRGNFSRGGERDLDPDPCPTAKPYHTTRADGQYECATSCPASAAIAEADGSCVEVCGS